LPRRVLSAGDDLGGGGQGMNRGDVPCSTRRSIIILFDVISSFSIANRIPKIYSALEVQRVVFKSLKLSQYLTYK
jgi:hypothetical protein